MNCIACKMKFGGLTGFDAHRTGDHAVSVGENRRRCRTPEEMEAIGYVEVKGVWKMPMPEHLKERLRNAKAAA